MLNSTQKRSLKAICLAGFLGVIVTGLLGCSTPASPYLPSEASPDDIGQSVEPPKITSLQVNKADLSAEGLDLDIEAKITNPNLFSVNINNPVVKILGTDGSNYSQSTAPDDQIKEMGSQTFNFSSTVPESVLKEEDLVIELGFNSEYEGKVLPVNDTASVDLHETLNNLFVNPVISLQAYAEKIFLNGTEPQLEVLAQGSIKNPNPYSLVTNAITITAQDSQGRTIASGLVDGNFTVAPNESGTFEKSLVMPVEELNEPYVTILADITTSSPYSMNSFKANAIMNMRTLADLIQVPNLVIDPKSTWTENNSYITLDLIIDTSLTNDNLFDLTAGKMDITVEKPVGTVAATSTQTAFYSGVQSRTTKTITNNIILHPQGVQYVGGEAFVSASIPIGIANVNETTMISSSTTFTVNP